MSDRWIAKGQIYITGDNGYGLRPDLSTVYIGTEAEIVGALEGKEEYAEIRRRLVRIGAYGEAEGEQESDGGYANEGTPRFARQPDRPAIRGGGRGDVARRLPRSPRSPKTL